MVDAVTYARLVGGFFLLLANGFFVTTEFALTRVPQFDKSEFQGHPGLERAWEMTERLEIYLSSCQVGITIASVSLGVVAEPALSAVLDAVIRGLGFGGGGGEGGHLGISIVLSLAIINILHVIIGEQAPTYLGVERSKWVAKYLGPMLYYWAKLMSPVIYFADWVAKGLLGLFGVTISRSWSEAEVEDEAEEGAESTAGGSVGDVKAEMANRLSQAGFSRERREEVLNAIEIGETPVSEILIPRDEMVTLDVDDTEGNLRKLKGNPQHSRFPLFAADSDEVVGIVYVSTVLAEYEALRSGEKSLADIATPPMGVDADLPISEVIDRFQAENQELAVVLDDGRLVGLVTASDAFEAIAGELDDPLDDVDDVPSRS
jgi:CBS domain containing-hemolysin-like protein